MKKFPLILSIFVFVAQSRADKSTYPQNGMVSSVNPVATEAGLNALKSGGNAIDAAVAVGLTLGVVDTANSGIGGGCFMLIHLADGRNIALDGREMAPAAATHDMFIRNGVGNTGLSQNGPLASGVPGELATFNHAVSHFGKHKLADALVPAAAIAEKGFKISDGYASRLKSVAKEMLEFSPHSPFLNPDESTIKAGTLFKQPELAATYRNIAELGIDWFYRGPFAKATAEWMTNHGGIMTEADFKNYTTQSREPVRSTYRGHEVVSFPPPSSGGVHVLEMLNILENFDLKKMDEVTRLHVIAEAMKLAFADRAYWLGDPDFAKVPRGLISKDYALSLAKKINLEHTTTIPSHGTPANWASDVFKKHTTHFSVADGAGNWVACTCTINTSFGSKVVIPGTGVVLNDEMDDFSVQPGVPNAFHLIGAEANAVAPGKRPLSSMSPTIVFKDGQPVIALGAAGGPKIITAVLMELIDMLDLGMTPAQALAAPRIHQQWSPDELMVEKGLSARIKAGLEKRGHKIEVINALAVSQIVARSLDGKGFIGAADQRANGVAAGY